MLSGIKGFLLDLDGTVYLGDNLLPGASEFIHRLSLTKRDWLFITNNCSSTPQQYSKKLTRLGISTNAKKIFTSGELSARYLLAQGVSKAFVLGTHSLKRQLKSFGIVHDIHEPQVVLSSFDKTLTYKNLLAAVRFVQKGLPLYSTHPDLVCPTPDGPIPDSGLITGMIEKTTSVDAKYLGKPMIEMVEGASEKLGLPMDSLAFIGDRLYTDMRMAISAGITSILVLSGEATEDDLATSPWQPDIVAQGIHSLIPYL